MARSAKAPRVLRKVKIGGAWLRLPVATIKGKLDWNFLRHKGELILSTEGTFYLEYRDPAKVLRAVGITVAEAREAWQTQAAVLKLRACGGVAEDAPAIMARRAEPVKEGKLIADVVKKFCERPTIGLRDSSITQYKFDLKYFGEWCKQTRRKYLEDLDRQDFVDFMEHLVIDVELELVTAKRKAVVVLKRMRDAGAAITMKKGDWPKVTQMQPEIYTPEQLKPLFAAMNEDEFVTYQTFLLTGFREQEVEFLGKTDFDPKMGTLAVTKKAGYKFDPKNYMERTISIHPFLVSILQQHVKKLDAGIDLLLPAPVKGVGTGKRGAKKPGKPNSKMLRQLKHIGLRAKLNCGRCHSTVDGKELCCDAHPVCRTWTLHKFRHTYATTLLQDGFDIVTVMGLLGHQKIETTMKYLRSLRAVAVREKMAASAIATMFLEPQPLQLVA